MKPDEMKVMTLVTETTTATFEVADGDPPEFSDIALAQRFAELHGDELRFISKWSQWYAWDETRWLEEITLGAFDKARAICLAEAQEAHAPHTKVLLASAKTVAAIERLAKADRCIARTVQGWDTDIYTFNTEAAPPGHDRATTGETTT